MGVVDKYQKPTRTVRIANAASQGRIDTLRLEIVQARLGDAGLDDPTPQLERDLAAAQADADQDALVFVFESLSGKELETVKLRHPSDDPALMFNVETFPPDLIAESCIKADDQDSLTIDEAETIWATFSAGDCEELYSAAWGVSTTANLRPFSVTDTGNPDQSSVPTSTTAPLEALHIANS